MKTQTMYTDDKHVTQLNIETVDFDGTANCEICAKPISYRSDLGKVPTYCGSCVEMAKEIALRYHGKIILCVPAGDGWGEENDK